ncbi:hypothetical protein GGX14DRAFT_558797 [Mycena pura]|uniref:Uncharacterized protein n=1 Tax=Mycena pura TaxID=153505 RepID=A0AAD6VS65_9AGAR|nr:hypothetical protein GGX14DRAFT_558797 [Mycena pura]
MFDFKLPGLHSLDQIINQNPLAQAAGEMGAAALGVADKPAVTQAVYDELVHYFKYASTAETSRTGMANGHASLSGV